MQQLTPLQSYKSDMEVDYAKGFTSSGLFKVENSVSRQSSYIALEYYCILFLFHISQVLFKFTFCCCYISVSDSWNRKQTLFGAMIPGILKYILFTKIYSITYLLNLTEGKK